MKEQMTKAQKHSFFEKIGIGKEQRNIMLFILLTFVVSRISFYLISGIGNGTWFRSDFLVAFNRWDAIWYKNYAEDILRGSMTTIAGRGEASWAFFPLYPLLLAGIWKLVGESHSIFLIGSAVSSVCFLLFEYVAYLYIMLTRKDIKQAYWYIFFMSCGLYSFYFSITYTESLFILLLALAFLFLYEEKYIPMGIVGIFLSASRAAGAFFVFAIFLKVLMDYVRKEQDPSGKKKSIGGFLKYVFGNAKLVLGTCLVPLGTFAYIVFLKWYTGDGLAFMHVQISWGRNTGRNIFQIFWDGLTEEFPASYLSIAVLLSLVLIVLAVIEKKRFDEMILPLLTLIANCTSSLNSSPRYMIGSFTMVLAFTDFFCAKSKKVKIVWAVVIVLLEVIFIYWWSKGTGLLA